MHSGNVFMSRRGVLRGGLTLGALAFFHSGVFAEQLARTQRLTEGPFCPDRKKVNIGHLR